jgi:uncharacterized protein YkvS
MYEYKKQPVQVPYILVPAPAYKPYKAYPKYTEDELDILKNKLNLLTRCKYKIIRINSLYQLVAFTPDGLETPITDAININAMYKNLEVLLNFANLELKPKTAVTTAVPTIKKPEEIEEKKEEIKKTPIEELKEKTSI